MASNKSEESSKVNKIVLTKEQEQLIIDIWNENAEKNLPPPSVKDLIFAVFDKKNMDARTHEGIAIREFLASRGKYQKIDFVKKGLIELTAEQKEYIENNISLMTTNEIARVLFNNPKLTPLSQETRSIINYSKTLNPALKYKDESELEEFRPPKNVDKLIPLINSIVVDAYDPEKIGGAQKKCLEACIGYLHSKKFLTDYKTYSDNLEREIFLCNYVRHIYDKNDLNQQDLDTICLYAQEIINHKNIRQHLNLLRETQEGKVMADDKLSGSLVESISQTHKDLDKSVIRQTVLLNDINEKRSERRKKMIESTSSLLNLMEMWREEETRNNLIDFAIEKKSELKDEIKELSKMDQIKGALWGMSQEELLNG